MEIHEITGHMLPEQPEPMPVASENQPSQPRLEKPKLYNVAEAAHIAEVLRESYDPEYILLFGSLCGGTPHSDVTAYDLLIVTREESYYGWPSAKRYLKYKMPPQRREIPYANVYLHTEKFVISQFSPCLWLARAEGEILYCSDRYAFRRPRKPFDYLRAFCEVGRHFSTFWEQGDHYLERANDAFSLGDHRQAAFFGAQAGVLFYHAMFFVFHGFDTDTHDIVLMHERLRTLSGELMLLFDSDNVYHNDTLPCLKLFLQKARYDPGFAIRSHELAQHLDRIGKMKTVVEKVCKRRIELYRSRIVTE